MNEKNQDIIVGQHVLAELTKCDPDLLNRRDFLVHALTRSAEDANATVLDVTSHQFEPHGVTAIALLAESHMSIHTWPEYGYAAVDIFTCGDHMRPDKAIDALKEALHCQHLEIKRIRRGMDAPNE